MVFVVSYPKGTRLHPFFSEWIQLLKLSLPVGNFIWTPSSSFKWFGCNNLLGPSQNNPLFNDSINHMHIMQTLINNPNRLDGPVSVWMKWFCVAKPLKSFIYITCTRFWTPDTFVSHDKSLVRYNSSIIYLEAKVKKGLALVCHLNGPFYETNESWPSELIRQKPHYCSLIHY